MPRLHTILIKSEYLGGGGAQAFMVFKLSRWFQCSAKAEKVGCPKTNWIRVTWYLAGPAELGSISESQCAIYQYSQAIHVHVTILEALLQNSTSETLAMHKDPLEGLWKHRFLGPNSRVSDSVGLECSRTVYVSNKFTGVATTAAHGSHFVNWCCRLRCT